MLKKFYYELWVDIILNFKRKNNSSPKWKIYPIIFMNMAMALNLAFIIAIIQRNIIGINFYHFEVDIFPGKNLDAFITFFVLFLLPNLILNYFLIFRNNRYEMLVIKYKYHEGILFNRYFIATLVIPIALIIIGKLLF